VLAAAKALHGEQVPDAVRLPALFQLRCAPVVVPGHGPVAVWLQQDAFVLR
jgi:hypothetical protein